MLIDTGPFIAHHSKARTLDTRPTKVDPFYRSKTHYEELLAAHVEKLSDLQRMLYAADRHALLVLFQGMDAAGKDGAIQHVMSGVNPQGVQVFSFKHPSASELQHDFLWRETACLPERGHIGIFNRSYYEEVLITRVHPEILAGEGVPGGEVGGRKVWKGRYRSIVDFEHHLHRNGTRIVKIFLHLSKGEQRRRFLARIDEADKNWKFGLDDVRERRFWPRYMRAYDECLRATSRRRAPWYIVPADDKQNARLIVSQVIIDTLEGLKLRYPVVDETRRRELRAIRRHLMRGN